MLTYLRQFFAERNVLEVETPVLSRHGVSDPHLDNITAQLLPAMHCHGGQHYLQTSPEYHMKRLLAAGSGAIFQVFRAFRDGERGERHNPEFSLLEWYRPGFDDHALMDEVGALVCGWLKRPQPRKVTYREALIEHAEIDPFTIELDNLRLRAASYTGNSAMTADLGRDECLDLVMTHVVEPELSGAEPVFIHDYPASQAALARINLTAEHPVAHRFELYVDGIELCNGYWELSDASEQRQRFAQDNGMRQAMGKQPMPTDDSLLAALEAGLPDCAGVALGLDRLLMCGLDTSRISDVMTFPLERA